MKLHGIASMKIEMKSEVVILFQQQKSVGCGVWVRVEGSEIGDHGEWGGYLQVIRNKRDSKILSPGCS